MAIADAAPRAGVQFAAIELRGVRVEIEHEWLFPLNRGPLLVFLHEGLGSLKMWRGFPRALCAAAGCRGIVYSRAGYGESSPYWPDEHWPLHFMHVEAEELLPRLLAAVQVNLETDKPVLIGHSDGASIALIHAALHPDRVGGVIAMAPHIMVERVGLDSIERTRQRFLDSDLPARLAKYHRNVERAFWGWANIWLHPEFPRWEIRSLLDRLRCPLLLIQGFDDQYGTMAQIDGIAEIVKQAAVVKLADCGHSPHLDQPAAVTDAIVRFLRPYTE